MPTYITDLTLTDRYHPEMRDQLSALSKTPREGWEFLESWKSGSVTYWRFISTQDHLSAMGVCAHLVAAAEDEAVNDRPLTAAIAIRDVSFELDEVLPYRYSKARPRGRGGPR